MLSASSLADEINVEAVERELERRGAVRVRRAMVALVDLVRRAPGPDRSQIDQALRDSGAAVGLNEDLDVAWMLLCVRELKRRRKR
jgi:hypothetical protein